MSDKVKTGDVLAGTVIKILKFGALVDLENGQRGLIHISQISKEYVKEISDHLHVGDKVKVRVVKLGQKDRIELTLKDNVQKEVTQASFKSQKSMSSGLTFSPFSKIDSPELKQKKTS